ncbi:polysaccharide deacetylase family protein, partial [Bacillus timonensis]|uniref:polysaccharide deacetylase family protein n=1 Tax=Bacillus timonensis TaxID=1033734 RepID=UPI0002887D15
MPNVKCKKNQEGQYFKNHCIVWLYCVVTLVFFFLLKTKFFLEADASEPVVETVAPAETPEKNKPIDDDLKVDDPLKGNIEEQKPTVEEPTTTTKPTVDPAPVTVKPTTPEVDDEQEADDKQEAPKETPAPPSRAVYLTFDDGPHKVSKDILALLDQYDAKATFFMLDNNIKNYPDAVKEMVSKGHSVGLHGVTHDKNKFYQSSKSVVGEMDQTQQTILELTGIETDLIRTPF